MAAHLLPIHASSAGIRASAVPGRRKISTPPAGNGNWWTPLFGWSSSADYIDSSSSSKSEAINAEERRNSVKIVAGCFTEEKAKQLRMKMAMESGNFHDVMYHSAIASRLASDFSAKQS